MSESEYMYVAVKELEVTIDIYVWNIVERWMKAMEKLEKVIVENGITYVLGADNLYYPDLRLPKGTDYPIGKIGYMRCEHLKKFKHGYYMELLLDGKLNEYLHDVDEECHEMLDRIVEQMKKKQGLTEKLKAENQMLWVRKIKTFGFVVKSKLRRNPNFLL